MTIEELLNISPEFRERFRKESTPRRVSIKEMEKERSVSMNVNIQMEEPFTPESRIEEVFMQKEELEEISKEIPKGSNLTNQVKSGTPKEVDAFGKEMEGYIVPDHYKTYLQSLRPGQEHMELTIAKESHALRSIIMKVDHQIDTECIVDPGSQIIAMSEAVCHDLALIYDPTIQLNMQSANGEIDRSLGLVRNVPC